MNEEIKFGWISTKDQLPPTHYIILFLDRYKQFHYGVLCSEFGAHPNKYWCHIHQRTYNKKEVKAWSLIPEGEAMRVAFPEIFKNNDIYDKLYTNLFNINQKIEQEIILDAKKRDYEKYPDIIIRNTIHRFSQELLGLDKVKF